MFGDNAAAAINALPPSMLSNLLVSLDAVAPGTATQLLRSPTGALRRVPGLHNNVLTEVRETGGAEAQKINRGRTAPRAVTRVQLASALCERAMAEEKALTDPHQAARILDRIDTRIDAIACGAIVAPEPGTKFDELPDRVQKFFRRHTLDEVSALTDVSQRLSDRLFADVTARAQVAAAPRRSTETVQRLAGRKIHTINAGRLLDKAASSGIAGGVEIAEGVVLTRSGSGIVARVDGLTLPVDPDTRIKDLVGRIPDVDFGKSTSIPAGGGPSGMNSVVQSMLVGTSPRAVSMRTAARRRIIERTFFGDTSMSYTAGENGYSLLAGKARAHTAAALASRPHSSRHGSDDLAQTTRIEGFDLARNLRFARESRSVLYDKLPPQLRHTPVPEAKLKRYAGPVSTDDRAAASRSGFTVRHPANTLARDYPAARKALATVDWNGTEPVSPTPAGRALSPEHQEVRRNGAKLVSQANLVARRGRNPELVSADTLIADAKLAEAFTVWDSSTLRPRDPKVLTAAYPVPSSYRDRIDQFITDVFPDGGTFTTRGYTLARGDGAVRGGAGKVRVRYLTADAMPIAGGAIVGTGVSFRVAGVDTCEDGTVEVRAVADQVAAGWQKKFGRRRS